MSSLALLEAEIPSLFIPQTKKLYCFLLPMLVYGVVVVGFLLGMAVFVVMVFRMVHF